MIVEIFVTQSQAEDPLPQQLFETVLGPPWISGIHEAIGETAKNAELLIELLKDYNTGI